MDAYIYDNVCEEKKYGYDFNWVPPNLADTNRCSVLRENSLACQFGHHSQITEALPTLTSKITSLIDYLGQANIALTELVSTILIQLS